MAAVTMPDGAVVEMPDTLTPELGARLRALQDSQSKPASSTLPANAGMGNFAASVAGLPVDTVTNALNLGIAGVGRLTGTTPDLIKNPVGGSESFKELMRWTGMPGLSPDNPTPNSRAGTMAYDLASRGAMIPGAALPAVGSMVAEKVGGPAWAGLGAMIPSGATQAYNAVRAPALARQQAQNTVRDSTLQPAQDAGYVLPPSAIKPSEIGNVTESFAGKAALKQGAELKNQQVTNKLAREELGMPENAPITEKALNDLRDKASAPYREVAQLPLSTGPRTSWGNDPIGPQQILHDWRDANFRAKQFWREYTRQGNVSAYDNYVALKAKASSLEDMMFENAARNGPTELIQKLKDARVEIAKIHDVERALNVGNGNVDARILGGMLDKGVPLSGNLETIGRFAQAFPTFTREASKVPAPGVSAMGLGIAGGMGLAGYHEFGKYGLAAAAIPFARDAVRGGILSDTFQQNFNRPNYAPALQPQNQLGMLMQQSIIQNQPKQ